MSGVFQPRVVLLMLVLVSGPVALAEVAVAPAPGVIEPIASTRPTPLRIVVVHWKIKPGREAEFLDYWSTRSVVGDRSGLVSDYLSSVEDRGRAP